MVRAEITSGVWDAGLATSAVTVGKISTFTVQARDASVIQLIQSSIVTDLT
jgi:hypothetical protein